MLFPLFEGQKIVIANDNHVLIENYIEKKPYNTDLINALEAVIGAESFVVNAYLCFWRDLHIPSGVRGLASECERYEFYKNNKTVVDNWLGWKTFEETLEEMGEIIPYLPKSDDKPVCHNMATVWFNQNKNHVDYSRIAAAVVLYALSEVGSVFASSFDSSANNPLLKYHANNLYKSFDPQSNKALVLNYLQHNYDAKSNIAQALVHVIGIEQFAENAIYFNEEAYDWYSEELVALNTIKARSDFYHENKGLIQAWLKAEAAIRDTTPFNFMKYPVPYSPISVVGAQTDIESVILKHDVSNHRYADIVDNFMMVMMGVIARDFYRFSVCHQDNKEGFNKGYEQAKADILALIQESTR